MESTASVADALSTQPLISFVASRTSRLGQNVAPWNILERQAKSRRFQLYNRHLISFQAPRKVVSPFQPT